MRPRRKASSQSAGRIQSSQNGDGIFRCQGDRQLDLALRLLGEDEVGVVLLELAPLQVGLDAGPKYIGEVGTYERDRGGG